MRLDIEALDGPAISVCNFLMLGLPKRIKIAKIRIDREGRVTFLKPNDVPAEDGWWQSVLSNPRALAKRTPLNDTMIGIFAGMYVEIFCENCRRHDWEKVDELLVIYGDRCAVGQAVNAQVNCKRSAKRCYVQFKMRQWEDAARLKRR